MVCHCNFNYWPQCQTQCKDIMQQCGRQQEADETDLQQRSHSAERHAAVKILSCRPRQSWKLQLDAVVELCRTSVLDVGINTELRCKTLLNRSSKHKVRTKLHGRSLDGLTQFLQTPHGEPALACFMRCYTIKPALEFSSALAAKRPQTTAAFFCNAPLP